MRKPAAATPRRPRAADMFIGAFLLVLTALIAIYSDRLSGGAIAAMVVIGALGLDAIASAMHGRRSLVSRIGPLP